MDDLQVRAAATDIFSYLVEFSPSMVREFVMQEPQQTDDVSKENGVNNPVCLFDAAHYFRTELAKGHRKGFALDSSKTQIGWLVPMFSIV